MEREPKNPEGCTDPAEWSKAKAEWIDVLFHRIDTIIKSKEDILQGDADYLNLVTSEILAYASGEEEASNLLTYDRLRCLLDAWTRMVHHDHDYEPVQDDLDNCFQICKLGKADHKTWIEMIKLIETYMYCTYHEHNTATWREDGTPEIIEIYKEVLEHTSGRRRYSCHAMDRQRTLFLLPSATNPCVNGKGALTRTRPSCLDYRDGTFSHGMLRRDRRTPHHMRGLPEGHPILPQLRGLRRHGATNFNR